MALTEFTHHASRGQTRARAREGVEHELNVGLRAQKTPLPGKRPGLPQEPEPLVRAVTDGYVAAQTSLLVVPSMAGGDTIDGTTLRFLLEHCLRMKTLLEEGGGEGEGEGGALLSFLGAQEDKEKEEKKESSSRRTDTTLWARVLLSLFVVRCLCGAFHAVFPSGSRPKMRGILADLFQKDCCALIVVSGSGMCKVGFTGDCMLIVSCSLLLLPGPRCPSSWPVWTRRTVTWYFPCHGAEAVSYGPDCSADP